MIDNRGDSPAAGRAAHPYRVPFLNTSFDNMSLDEVREVIADHVRTREPGYMVSLNTDIDIMLERDPEFKRTHEDATLVLMDSQPLFNLATRQGIPVKEKISGSDLLWPTCQWAAEEKWSVYILGGMTGIPEKAAENLVAHYPGLHIVGTDSPELGFEKNEAELQNVLDNIRKASPDILFVCLGAPKSEKLIHSQILQLGVPFSLAIGAAVDFAAGTVKRAPKWMSEHSLEWLYRFTQEPSRLFRRYFIDSWAVLGIIRKYGKRQVEQGRPTGDGKNGKAQDDSDEKNGGQVNVAPLADNAVKSATNSVTPVVTPRHRLRVLLLVYRWYPDGGVENFLRQLIADTSSQVDYAIASLTTSVDSTVPCPVTGPVIPSGKIQDMYLPGNRIEAMMRAGHFDVVHIQSGNGAAFYLAWLAKRAGIPCRILHSHNAGAEISYNPAKKLVSDVSAALWSGAPTNLWSCSTDAGRFLFGDRSFTVFFNGIDTNRFRFSEQKRREVRRELGVNEETFLVGSIGRIALQKNPLFQLHIFDEVRRQNPRARFCMVGSGDMEDARNAELQKLGLADSVIIVPRTSKSDAFYSAFDAMILPSLFEGLPFVGIEAQCNGVPLYASDTITRDIDVTDRISYLSIKEDPQLWAGNILAGEPPSLQSRAAYADVIRDAGFDRTSCAQAVAEGYTAAYEAVREKGRDNGE